MATSFMAAGNFGSPMQLIILLIIIVVLFGSRLPNIGSQLGGAIKGFKKAMNDDEQKKLEEEKQKLEQEKVIDLKKVETEKEHQK